MSKDFKEFAEAMDRRLEESRSPRGAARLTIRSIVSWDDPLNRPPEIYIARYGMRVEEESERLKANRRRARERYLKNGESF